MNINFIVENIIIKKLFKAIIEKGYYISIYNMEENTVSVSNDLEKLMTGLRTTHSDCFYVFADPHKQGIGWIDAIYGNGVDVLSDWTIDLNDIMDPIMKFVDRVEEEEFSIEELCKLAR